AHYLCAAARGVPAAGSAEAGRGDTPHDKRRSLPERNTAVNPRLLVPITLVTVLGIGGWYVDSQRAHTRSTLSGFFESQPTTLSRLRNGPLPEEINASRDKLRQAQALYRRSLAGPRPQEIEQARAAERNARARLAQAERGLTPEERAQARARRDAAAAQETLA